MVFLITGVTGFVGSNMSKFLINEGHDVYGLVRPMSDVCSLKKFLGKRKIKFLPGDISNVNEMKKVFTENSFDGVFHFAAQAHPPTGFKELQKTFQTNVIGTVVLVDAISQFSPNTIIEYCSTSEVYGNLCKNTGILKEDDITISNNPYGTSKLAGDLFMQERMMNGFIKGIITRAFSHTGPMRGRFFSISSDAYQIARMILGKQNKVLKVGNLKTKRAVMDVRDCCWVYYNLMINSNAIGKIFNICDENIHEMQYYTNLLIKVSGLKGIVQEIEPKYWRKIDIDVQIGDNTKINDLINWNKHNRIPIEKTMKDLLDYWVDKLRGEE